MSKTKIVSLIVMATLLFTKQPQASEGYYKTLFMDGGVGLNNLMTLPAADYLGYTWEYLATNTVSIQTRVMIKNDYDDNGVLLYPDGEPRFKIIFGNGGDMDSHGESLGQEGRGRVRTFYYRGGSFTGACASAYIVTSDSSIYFNLWPGSMTHCGMANTTVGGVIPPTSPLLYYYDFGADNYIEAIVHSRGGFATSPLPPGTEVLLIHDRPGTILDKQVSSWAYKDNDTTGRIVVMSSHPENEYAGERRDFAAAVFKYAADGAALPSIKGALVNGIKRIMDKSTTDNDPLYTKIGDKQYHHFTVDLPEGAKNLTISLDGNDTFRLNLYAAKDTFAFAGLADFADTSSGADKSISIDSGIPGRLYIGVECATTVSAAKVMWGYEYSGQLSVLNGVEYSITANWNMTDIFSKESLHSGIIDGLIIDASGKSVSICVKSLQPYSFTIHDLKGTVCREPAIPLTTEKYLWQPESSGMYIIRIQSGRKIISKRFTVVK